MILDCPIYWRSRTGYSGRQRYSGQIDRCNNATCLRKRRNETSCILICFARHGVLDEGTVWVFASAGISSGATLPDTGREEMLAMCFFVVFFLPLLLSGLNAIECERAEGISVLCCVERSGSVPIWRAWADNHGHYILLSGIFTADCFSSNILLPLVRLSGENTFI